MTIFTVDRYGRPGMPTFNIKKIRRFLGCGKAEIFRYHPFTVRLLYAESLDVQPVEMCIDAGDGHIGISVKSRKHEFVHSQYDPLPDEKERHEDRRRYRRMRRNRLRFRKPRFDNRRKPEDWLAPTVEHKKDLHVGLAVMFKCVCPLTSVTVETGSFDTQELEAIERGLPLPKGTDYQQGPRYRVNTLRDAVFYRDGHTCRLCGGKGKVLRMHHAGYWRGDHSDRMGNLITLCTGCHTAANHKKGGPLYGWKPKVMPMKGAAFMNQVRFRVVEETGEKTGLPVNVTWGSATKTARKYFCIRKTHANDAFVMGVFHPAHRCREQAFCKQRRNERRLQKFYDAVYTDIRDGKEKSGQELSCGRTKRSEPRRSERDLRPFRGHKVKKGHITIRRQRTQIKPGSQVRYGNEILLVHGTHTRRDKKSGQVNTNVEFTHPAKNGRKSADLRKVTVIREQYTNAWRRVT